MTKNRIQLIEESEKLYPTTQQICTCETGIENDYIKCHRHLSRYYQNKGCYWCNYSDCSKYGC